MPLLRVPAARHARAGALAGTLGGLGLCAGDAALLGASRAGATWGQWAQAAALSGLVGITTAAALGVLAGPLVAPVLDRAGRTWRALRGGDEGVRARLERGALAAVVLLPLGLWASYRATLTLLFAFARPQSVAAGVALAHAGLAVGALLAWGPTSAVAARVLDRARRAPRLGRVARSGWAVPGFLAATVAIGAAAVALRAGGALSSLPWRDALPVALAALGVVAAAKAPPWLRRGLEVAALAVVVAGASVGARLRPEATVVRSLGLSRALGGRVGHAAWTLALDFDRDGQLGVLGGGDCAPFDARRYTGAPEIPGNGVDEDCDGTDLPQPAMRPRVHAAPPAGVVPPHPTVVLVTVDALAARELAAFGGASIMPRLDALAARSVAFTSCFSHGPSTRMSFPSMFTSRWDSEQAFVYAPRMPYAWGPAERSLQEAFGDAGYEGAAILPNEYFTPARWASLTRGFREVDASAVTGEKHDAPAVTDAALRALREPRERPLYLWVHYYDAHPPYLPLPGAAPADRSDRALYEAELRFVDAQLGRLLDAVEALPSPAYVVVTADHGTSFHPVEGARRYHYGYDLYTSTLHVPLVVHGPGLAPRRVDEVASTMDVAPTLADLVGLDDRGRFEGTSLVPALFGAPPAALRATFHELDRPEYGFTGEADPLELVSVRTDRWDLVLARSHGRYELYDWRGDYFEQNDLYEERAATPEIARLRALLAEFLAVHAR